MLDPDTPNQDKLYKIGRLPAEADTAGALGILEAVRDRMRSSIEPLCSREAAQRAAAICVPLQEPWQRISKGRCDQHRLLRAKPGGMPRKHWAPSLPSERRIPSMPEPTLRPGSCTVSCGSGRWRRRRMWQPPAWSLTWRSARAAGLGTGRLRIQRSPESARQVVPLA